MSKAKRKNKKELVMQKRYWDQIKKRYPFLEEKTHWYTGTKLSKKKAAGAKHRAATTFSRLNVRQKSQVMIRKD